MWHLHVTYTIFPYTLNNQRFGKLLVYVLAKWAQDMGSFYVFREKGPQEVLKDSGPGSEHSVKVYGKEYLRGGEFSLWLWFLASVLLRHSTLWLQQFKFCAWLFSTTSEMLTSIFFSFHVLKQMNPCSCPIFIGSTCLSLDFRIFDCCWPRLSSGFRKKLIIFGLFGYCCCYCF